VLAGGEDPDHRLRRHRKVEDVVEYMLAGASGGHDRLPRSQSSGMLAILDGLEQWCAKRGIPPRVADLTGAMIYDKPANTFVAAAAPIG